MGFNYVQIDSNVDRYLKISWISNKFKGLIINRQRSKILLWLFIFVHQEWSIHGQMINYTILNLYHNTFVLSNYCRHLLPKKNWHDLHESFPLEISYLFWKIKYLSQLILKLFSTKKCCQMSPNSLQPRTFLLPLTFFLLQIKENST